jgi:hypothetical protein
MMHIKQIRNFKELNKGHNSMKKLLLGVVLMLVSSIATSATISIGNPTITNSNLLIGPNSNLVSSQELSRIDTINSNLWLGGTVRAEWNILASNDSSFTLNMISNHSNRANWTVSIFDMVTGSWNDYSYGTAFDIALAAGNSIKVAMTGIIARSFLQSKSFNTTLNVSGLTNLEVSEVPLPAAVWLFGSVLLGGLAFRRKAAQKRQLALAV